MRFIPAAALVMLAAQGALAQQQPAASMDSRLSLDEAIAIARQNNPSFQQSLNFRRTAEAQVRSAYASFLPSVSTSFSSAFNQGGTQYFGGSALTSSSNSLSSSYSLGLGYNLSGASILAPKVAKANQTAVEADIEGARELLRQNVTQQYLTVLAAQARAEIQDTLVATARTQLELAKTRVEVGAGTSLDVRRAEVALGQAEVTALTARNAVRIEKLRLYQVLGVVMPADVQLTTTFQVVAPDFKLDSLLALARASNPGLEALRSRERASGTALKQRQSAYTPTLSMSAGFGGQAFQYTDGQYPVQAAEARVLGQRASCLSADSVRSAVGLPSLNCNQFVFTPDMAAAARSANSNWPFRFDRQPMQVSATIRFPIFDNWNRELQVQQAAVERDNARYSTRARELQLQSDVTQAYLNVVTAARTVALRETNLAQAREELALATERYRVGAGTFLDVATSRNTYEQAQIDRVAAVYDYHRSFAALENAVGRPLR
ncbi:MAG: TolC family protein [Gemmatimonadaceae bacterium]